MNLINSLILSISILGFGFFISDGLKNFNRPQRTISVKGLSEREVKADLAIWKISFNVSSQQIEDVKKQLPLVQNELQSFLLSAGFTINEVTKDSSIQDRQAQDYAVEKGNRFVATGFYLLQTSKVELVEKTQQQLDELVQKGIVITGNKKIYYYTGLNEIKPEMLDDATKNAKIAAMGFAKSMSVAVGKLKSASQGTFTISNLIGQDDYYDGEQSSSIAKKVRVVTQVEFFIE